MQNSNPIWSTWKSSVEMDLISKLEPVLEDLGFELRDIEVLEGRESQIRISIENPPSVKEDGNVARESISIEDCTRAHYALSPMFDVWDPLPGAYNLEICSPGEKPHMRISPHFAEAVGERIRFQSLEAIPLPPPSKPRRNWEGVLKEFDGTHGKLTLVDNDNKTHTLAIEDIKNAVWMREWAPNGRDDKNNRGKKHK